VVLTFDDGYRNVFTAAVPRLTERAMPATVFLVTDRMRDTHETPALGSWTPPDDEQYGSWTDVEALSHHAHVSFGSHTCSHSRLPALTSADLVRELRDSLIALAAHGGNAKDIALAYPYGASTPAIAEAARAAGYRCALTTDAGINNDRTDLFALRRILIGDDDTIPAFAARVAGLTGWVESARRWWTSLAGTRRMDVRAPTAAQPAGSPNRNGNPIVESCPVCTSHRARPLAIRYDGASLYRCLDCRLVCWETSWDARDVAAHYRDYYADAPLEGNAITQKRYHAVLDHVERYVSPGPLLEVGCGAGHFLAVAEARGWQPTGLEVSASGCRTLERLKAARGYRFAVQGIDVMEASFPAGYFHAAVLIEVVEHLIDPLACLRRLREWLAPGGVLYLTTPNFDSLSRLLLAGRWRAIEPEHRYLFTPRTMTAALAAVGFRPVRLLTKNVDLPEIVSQWRRRGTPEPRVSTAASTETFRGVVESSAPLRVAKATVNGMLRLAQLGETLEVFGVKQNT